MMFRLFVASRNVGQRVITRSICSSTRCKMNIANVHSNNLPNDGLSRGQYILKELEKRRMNSKFSLKEPNLETTYLGKIVVGISSLVAIGLIGTTGSYYLNRDVNEPMTLNAFGYYVMNNFVSKSLVSSYNEKREESLLPSQQQLLPSIPDYIPEHQIPKTLVIDVEDTLIHLEWTAKYGWRAVKRPGATEFLHTLAQYYEIVLFSEQPFLNVEQFLEALDPINIQAARYKLYRNSCSKLNDTYVKDLSYLNRDLAKVVILDDNPKAYQLQPENGIHIKPFTQAEDTEDTALLDLIPFFVDLAKAKDVREKIKQYKGQYANQDIADVLRQKNENRLQQMKQSKVGGVMRRFAGNQFKQSVSVTSQQKQQQSNDDETSAALNSEKKSEKKGWFW